MKYLICLLLAAAALTAAAAPTFDDNMAQRTLACTVCHGKEGRAGPDGYYPRIAGKPAGYLYNQLLNFRDGRRHYGLMARLLDPLSDAYLLEIAQHFASLDLPYPPPPPPAASRRRAAARGRRWRCRATRPRQSRPARDCHGERADRRDAEHAGPARTARATTSMPSWAPGAPAQRRAHAPDCMAQIARQLPPEDLTAVDRLAGGPAAAGGRAAGALAATAPGDRLRQRQRGPPGASHEAAIAALLLGGAGGAGRWSCS